MLKFVESLHLNGNIPNNCIYSTTTLNSYFTSVADDVIFSLPAVVLKLVEYFQNQRYLLLITAIHNTLRDIKGHEIKLTMIDGPAHASLAEVAFPQNDTTL